MSLKNRLTEWSERLAGREKQVGNEIAAFSRNGCILVISDKGGNERYNHDCAGFYTDEDETLLVAADGVGSGGMLSRLAAKISVERLSDPKENFPDAVRLAHRDIQALPGAKNNIQVAAILAAARIKKDRLKKVHLGDARMYHLRLGSVLKVTEDHVKTSSQRPGKTTPISALSAAPDEDLSRFDSPEEWELQEGDRIVMMSDGLHHGVDNVPNDVILAIGRLIEEHGNTDSPEVLARRIRDYLREVAENTSEDNISLILYSHKKPLISIAADRMDQASKTLKGLRAGISDQVAARTKQWEEASPGTKKGAKGVLLAGLGAAALATAYHYWPEGSEPVADKNVYEEVCKEGVPGTWSLAAKKTKKPASLKSYVGHTVDLQVVDKDKKVLVEMNELPGDCIANGKAPRAIAAAFPSGNDKVLIQDGAVTTPFHFTPATKESNALQQKDSSVVGDLSVGNEGSVWIHCAAPVSLGCSQDAESISSAF